MKVLLFVVVAFVGALAVPMPEPARTIRFKQTEQKYALIPDGSGQLHYVDLEHMSTVPEPRFNADQDMIFRLFTRRNPNNAQIIQLGNTGSLTGSQFNGNHPTRIIIHGWNNDGNSEVNQVIRQAYINRGEFNIITVDWGIGANTINYVAARNRVSDVGAVTARLVDFLNQFGNMGFNQVSVIGHSLGGHAAGHTGKRVSRGRLHTVIAMDPAAPLFSLDNPDRVASNDANYVEVIHTNGGLLGFDAPLGLADFYPNGGRSQPGCGIDIAGTCAHSRAYLFFAESVNSNRFVSTRCQNHGQITNGQCTSSGPSRPMGGEPSNHGQATGVYFLTTNANSPFAQG